MKEKQNSLKINVKEGKRYTQSSIKKNVKTLNNLAKYDQGKFTPPPLSEVLK